MLNKLDTKTGKPLYSAKRIFGDPTKTAKKRNLGSTDELRAYFAGIGRGGIQID